MRRAIGLLLAGLAVLAMAGPARAEEDAPPLSPAQTALFGTPHLAAIRAPLDLDYRFLHQGDGQAPVEDRITMEVRAVHADGRHDVYPDVLTGERHVAFPPALGFRGNPLLMFALERDAHLLAAATGGSASWFRNRIRRAFADGATLRETRLPDTGEAQGAPALEISITPFRNEPRARHDQERRYLFLLSEAVPGGIAEIRAIQPLAEGGEVVDSIRFAGTRPR
jgi:hypothetical protein